MTPSHTGPDFCQNDIVELLLHNSPKDYAENTLILKKYPQSIAIMQFAIKYE